MNKSLWAGMLVCALIGFGTVTAKADTVTLKDGQKVKGMELSALRIK